MPVPIPAVTPNMFLLAAALSVGVVLVVTIAASARPLYKFVLTLLGRDPEMASVEHRRCRYCFLGWAKICDERAQVEGDDLVEVRCYVCRSCGLPQWTVERSPVLRRAA